MQRLQGEWDVPMLAACRLWAELLKTFCAKQLCSRGPFTQVRGRRGCAPAPVPSLSTFWHRSINCSLSWFVLATWTEIQELIVCLSNWISKRGDEAFYLKAGSHTSTRVCPRGLLLLKESSMAKIKKLRPEPPVKKERHGMCWGLWHWTQGSIKLCSYLR